MRLHGLEHFLNRTSDWLPSFACGNPVLLYLAAQRTAKSIDKIPESLILVRVDGIEPSASILSEWRSTTELHTQNNNKNISKNSLQGEFYNKLLFI